MFACVRYDSTIFAGAKKVQPADSSSGSDGDSSLDSDGEVCLVLFIYYLELESKKNHANECRTIRSEGLLLPE